MKSPVLLYHKIDRPTGDVRIRGAFTSPRKFERQMSYLKRKGFEFYTAWEFAEVFRDNGRFPLNGICLTFDDGWKDNYTHAFPILKKLGVKATIFIVPACVGRTTARVTADGEGPREHLSESDIREMSAEGIEFGSHSFSHKLFDRITPEEITAEVVDSKNYLENLLQKGCKTFAYPAGFFTPFAQTTIRDAGYTAAFSTVYGSEANDDLFALNRTEILRKHGLPFQFARHLTPILTRPI